MRHPSAVQIENLVIKRVQVHNSLNQPPVVCKTYQIVVFFAASYFLINFIIILLQNIVFFSSSSFSDIISQNSETESSGSCGKGSINSSYSSFIAMFVISELIPFYGALISYLVLELVIRRHRPQVKEYRYHKQLYMVKFVTLDGYIFKGFIISIDLFNIFYALIVSGVIHNN